MCALLVACGGAGTTNDDLGYDPAVPASRGDREPLFAVHGLPIGSSGAPLRAAAVEGEWRTFRGNTERSGTRLAPGISAPTIRWSVQVGIQGYANTPLVTDDTIFVTSQGDTHDLGDAEDGFYAISRSDGSRLWFFPTNEDINGGTLTDELVLGGADDGTLYAIDRESGRKVWEVELGHQLNHGPTVVGDLAYVQNREGVSMIEVRTGTIRQRMGGAMDGWSVRGALAADEERVFRSSNECGVGAYSDGDSVWEASSCSPATEEWISVDNYTPPGILGDAVLTLAPIAIDYSSARMSLSLIDANTGASLWQTETERLFDGLDMRSANLGYDQNYHASMPWVMNGIAWVPQITFPSIVGFDLATGNARAIAAMPDCRCRQFASIVGVPSRGYFARHDGRLIAFAPATGSVLWSLTLQYNAASGALPVSVLSQGFGTMYQDAYCYADPWDGSALFSTPAIGEDGTLYVGSGEGFLYAIGEYNW